MMDETSAPEAPADLALEVYRQLARIRLGEQPLSAVIEEVARLARDLIPGADEVSITLVERGRARTVAFSPGSTVAAALDERQYDTGFGPCLHAAASGQTVAVPDTSKEDLYADFAAVARSKGVHRTLAVGMPTLQETTGALNLYSFSEGGTFEDDVTREVATAFVGFAAATMHNAALYAGAVEEVAQLHQALASRATIEQAKGILMRDRCCGPELAFELLVKLSNESNRKLRDVADVIVADAVRPR